jgi:hypothetical protein
MPPLDKKLFAGDSGLTIDELKQVEVRNFHQDVIDRLKNCGWNGKAKCCCVGLTLSLDNKKVIQGAFLVKGDLNEKLTIEANKIWPSANSKVNLVLSFPNGEVFTFSEGDLGSDIVPQQAVEQAFYLTSEGRPPAVILEADYAEYGLGAFSLRMTCVLSKNSSEKAGVIVKYTVLLFPESKESLLADYALSQSAAWPGIRLTEGYLPLLPRPYTKWQCPVTPFVLAGVPLDEASPTSACLRRAVAAMMAKTVEPETARTGAAVLSKWLRLTSNPEDMLVKTGEVTWPQPKQPEPETGKWNMWVHM